MSNDFELGGSDLISITFITPAGEEISNPDPERVTAALMTAGPAYWEAGSGDAALRRKCGAKVLAEVIIMIREPYGVFVQFVDPKTSQEFVLSDLDSGDEEIIIQHAGDPWELPKRFFVKREIANQAVRYFMAQGERSPELSWENF